MVPAQVVVGRVGRAHGIRGATAVAVHTDVPEVRFADGAVLLTDPPARGPLTVASTVWHSGRLLVSFRGVSDRSAAEALSGTTLLVAADRRGDAGAEAWWDEDLVGLDAVSTVGDKLGVVAEVVHAPAQDLLLIRRDGAPELLVPFVAAIVPTVDRVGGRLVIDPPEGLLEL